MSHPFAVVLVTAPTQEVARTLARSLVESRLAACVNLVPNLTSIYRWQGEIHEDPEVLLIIKTTTPNLPALTSHIEHAHPYTVPEVIHLPIPSGSSPYLAWLTAQTTPDP